MAEWYPKLAPHGLQALLMPPPVISPMHASRACLSGRHFSSTWRAISRLRGRHTPIQGLSWHLPGIILCFVLFTFLLLSVHIHLPPQPIAFNLSTPTIHLSNQGQLPIGILDPTGRLFLPTLTSQRMVLHARTHTVGLSCAFIAIILFPSLAFVLPFIALGSCLHSTVEE